MENKQAARFLENIVDEVPSYHIDDAQRDAVMNKWREPVDLSTLEQIQQLDL